MKNSSINVQKITIHYAAAFAVFFSAFCMVRSFISVYLLDRGFTYTQVGIITGFHMFVTAVIQPNYSLILNKFPKLTLQRFMTLCCIPAILSSLLTFFLPANLLFFIPIYIIFGLTEIGMQSLMVSVGMEYVNAGIPVNTGVGRGFGSAGYAIANMLLGTLIVRFGAPISQKLNIALMLLLAIMLITLPEPSSLTTIEQTESEKDEAPADDLFTFLRSNHIYALFALSVIFIFFGHSIVNTYLPNVVGQFGLGSDFAGMANAVAAWLELIPMIFYNKLSKHISPLKLLYISAVFFTVKLLTATLAKNSAGIIASQSMQILAYALFSMASIYFTNQAVRPHNRIMAQGLLVGANEAGFTLGSLIGGIVLDHQTIRTLLWMGVVSTVIGSILMIISITKFRKQNSAIQ